LPPSDFSKARKDMFSKAREDMRGAETGASKPGSSGAPVDEADEAAALLKELTVGAIASAAVLGKGWSWQLSGKRFDLLGYVGGATADAQGRRHRLGAQLRPIGLRSDRRARA
jgi:hypothetical protein